MTRSTFLPRWAGLTGSGRRIGTRLGLGFAAVFVVAVLAAGVGAWQMRRMHQQFDGMLDQRVPVLIELQALAQDVTAVNLAARDAVLAATPEAAAAALKQIEDGRTEIGEHIARLQPLLAADSASQASADEVGTMSSGVLVVLLKFSRQLKAEQADAAKALLTDMLRPRMAAFVAKVETLQELQVKRLEEMRRDANRAAELSLALIGTALLLGMAIAAVLAWAISRSISQAVNATVTLAEGIADGDLSRVLQVNRSDELGRLQQALLGMQRQLNELVGSMRTTADRVGEASREIAEGSRHLSARSESATGALKQTASAMHLLVNTVSNSAQAAVQADLMATQSAESADRGGQVMSEMDRRMDQIAESSRRISDITGVIDSIAFQTNILALNAAVEAARAGEQGRGFAVVAGEVRALAQRSASAAREIKTLISNSVGQVESGSRLVKEAGGAMRDIVDSVGGVSGIVQCISADGKSQHAGLAEISHSVTQLDEMTQQNAALVQRSAGAAEDLAEQAASLQALINRFRLATA